MDILLIMIKPQYLHYAYGDIFQTTPIFY